VGDVVLFCHGFTQPFGYACGTSERFAHATSLRRTPVAVRAGKPSFARLLTVIRTTLLTTLRCSRQHCQRFVLGITSEAEADTPSVALCFFKKRTL
jgi:hypothetical protein